MCRQLIGQLLTRMGKLTLIDIDEILVEQAVSRKRFGDIAMSWGLCDPEHIGEAWCNQLTEEGGQIDLDGIGIDACAASYLTAELARRLRAIPIRILGDLVVVATSRAMSNDEADQLSQDLGRPVRCVTVDEPQIDRALEVYYAPPA